MKRRSALRVKHEADGHTRVTVAFGAASIGHKTTFDLPPTLIPKFISINKVK